MSKAGRLVEALTHVARSATVEPAAVRDGLREAARDALEAPAAAELPAAPTLEALRTALARPVVARVRRRLLEELGGLQMLDRGRLAHAERLLDGLSALESGTAQPGAGFRLAIHVRAIRRMATPPDSVQLQAAARLPGLPEPDRAALAARLEQLAQTQDAALPPLLALLEAAAEIVEGIPASDDASPGKRMIA